MSQKWVSRGENARPSDEHRPIVAQVLASRNWVQDAEQLLNPRLDQITDPSQMMGMNAAVERVGDAITAGECLAVYGDYDIDGMSGLSLLSSFFKACGAKDVLHYQPKRLSEGYGVHPSALDDLHAQGAKVVITVDTGITACSAAERARELGLDLVITDHHQPLAEMPRTPWIVNPNQRGDTSKLGYLSGTGVAFYFCMALRRHLRDKGHFKNETGASREPDLRYWLDLFALGTVADHVPLVGDNRNLVRVGLGLLRRSHRPGLRALVEEILPDPEQNLTARDIAFSIAPKLNAASRLGQAELSTKLLMCTNPVEADDIVVKLFELNATRSEIQKKVFAEAQAQGEILMNESPPPEILVIAGHWHEGVLGIVAAKIVETFGRPAIILGALEDGVTFRGSMRGRAGWSCVRLLEKCAPHLIKFGGHDMAAGLQLLGTNLTDFRTVINEAARNEVGEGDEASVIELKFDGELPSDIRPDDLNLLDTLGPWGEGNPEPLFLVKNMSLEGCKHLKDVHFKSKFDQRFDVIGFYKSAEIKKLQNIGVQNIDALVRPEINRFRNAVSVQLRLEHLRASET